MLISSRNITYKKVLDEWLDSKKDSIKVSSYQKYELYINNYIIPYFSNISFKDLNEDFIYKYFNTDVVNKLSISSKNMILTLIKSSINYGIKIGLRKNNININITFKNNLNRINCLTINEQSILEDYIKNNINLRNLAILTSLYTGIRIGELCALKGSDIDFINNTITINKSIQRIKSNNVNNKTKLIIDTPKTKSSIRIIPVPKFIINYLKTFITNENNYIFTNNIKPKDPRSLEKYFSSVLKKLNIRHINYHSLRHTFATRLKENKTDIKVISELLGHSSWIITQGIYIHATFEYKRKSITELADNWNN